MLESFYLTINKPKLKDQTNLHALLKNIAIIFLAVLCTNSAQAQSRQELERIVTNASMANGIDPKLVFAMVEVESSWDPKRIRLEPTYRYVFEVNFNARRLGITAETEHVLQKLAYGLMQVTGGTARSSMAFKGPLTDLLDPETNVMVGTGYLKSLMLKHPRLSDQIASYNAGSPRRNESGEYINQSHVDKVMRAYNSIK